MPTMEAINTRLVQSSANWRQAAEQGQQLQQQARTQQENLAQQIGQQQGRAMRV
jgi:hypothetical protein